MTLRKRLFSLAIPLLLLTLLLIGALSQSLLLARFDANDEHQLQGEANSLALQIDSFISRSVDVLRVSAWSNKTYEFIRGNYPQQFDHQNLDIDSVRNQDFNFLLFFDEAGRLKGEQWANPDLLDLRAGLPAPTMPSLRRDVLQRTHELGMLGSHGDARQSSAQMVLIQGIPVVLISSPISDDAGIAHPVGNAVAGRFLGLHRQRLLERFISGNLHVLPPAPDAQDWSPLPGNQYLRSTDIKIGPRYIADKNMQEIDLLFSNRLGAPELRMQISQPRLFLQRGNQTLMFFLTLATLLALAALLLVYLGLERWILLRVQRLNRDVASIGPGSALPRLAVHGNDELSSLTGELNGMFERLAQSEDRGKVILDSISDGYVETGLYDQITSANRALHEMLGYPAEGLIDLTFSSLFAPMEGQPDPQMVRQTLLEEGMISFQAAFKCTNGNLRWFEAKFSQTLDTAGEIIGYRGIMRDISEQMAYQNQLIDLAYRDTLTGLGNRKAFYEQLERHVAASRISSESTAVLFLDLDHFKEVNDRYGHQVGDGLLISVAERLRGSLRHPDRSFRLGGDEFTVVMHKVNQQEALALGERLLRTLGEDYVVDGIRIDVVSPSIGVALYPSHADNVEDLVRAADSAMYFAKRRRNCCCLFEAHMLDAAGTSTTPPTKPQSL
ncbi:diguanylate cyclase (GGDEF) domain protein [compost metagenome]